MSQGLGHVHILESRMAAAALTQSVAPREIEHIDTPELRIKFALVAHLAFINRASPKHCQRPPLISVIDGLEESFQYEGSPERTKRIKWLYAVVRGQLHPCVSKADRNRNKSLEPRFAELVGSSHLESLNIGEVKEAFQIILDSMLLEPKWVRVLTNHRLDGPQ